jgi:hypothetical protein
MPAASRHVLVLSENVTEFCIGQPFTAEDYEESASDISNINRSCDPGSGGILPAACEFERCGLETLPQKDVSAAVKVMYDCAKSVDEALRTAGKLGVDVIKCNLRSIAEGLAAYCVRAGISELHTNGSRDPWTLALDASVAAALVAKGVRERTAMMSHHDIVTRRWCRFVSCNMKKLTSFPFL